ncbi:MAG: ACT domain-containing protein [Candidatus Altimarinota bacterium]
MKARIVTEISCYLDNKPGNLAQLTELLAQGGVNIKGIQAYEGSLQSMVMLVVDQPDTTEQVMRKMGITMISYTDILEVDVPNRVGGLAEVSRLFGKHGVNIKTLYSCDNVGESSAAYFRVDDVELSLKALTESSK